MHERSIFMEVLDYGDPGEREAYLRRACAGDERLRARVEALLRRDQATDGLVLDRIPDVDLDATGNLALPSEEPGATIGPYRLLEQIGEGGMGVVYMAEQHRPVRRKVALKVIKPGMDTHQVIARFEAERQALAMMDHPNIAKVHDAGATESGRPYFVMELVKGIPITDYCDKARLSVPERLDLFVLVCRAVQHAHQKGIIHRDLKPSNILVTLIDGAAVPKVIDFGVAKATGGHLTDRSLFTGFAQLIGTPLYMSPEQAELSGVDVDTRSDIYALGVLLYELLTGTTPIDRDTICKAAYDEIRRVIREQEPPTPSTRLSSLGATLSTVSANRHSDARHLSHSVRGELDWIVMKALEKDRTQRYETANDFAADVMRHLTDKPVEACPPSACYRFTKYARRNRAALTTAALVGLTLVAGSAVSSWQAVRATRAGALAGQREKEARNSAAESSAVLQFFIRDVLGSAAPEKALGRDLKVSEALANAEKSLDTAFADQPLVEAGVRHALGVAYHSLGRDDVAVRHAERARDLRLRLLGPEHLDTLRAMHTLAIIFAGLGRYDEARSLDEQALGSRERLLGPEHLETLSSMNNLALVLRDQGKLDKARSLYERTLEIQRRVLGPEHPDTLTSMNNLAIVLMNQGKLDEARALHEQSMEIERRLLGPEDPGTLCSMHNLAWVLERQGTHDEARKLYEQVLEIRNRVLGPGHPDTLKSMSNLAGVFWAQDKLDEARRLIEQTLAIRRRVLGPNHSDTIGSMNNLAAVLHKQGKLDEARPLHEKSLEISRRVLGPDHRDTLGSMNNLVESILATPNAPTHDLARALEFARQLAERSPVDPLHQESLAVAEYRNGHWEASIRAAEKCLELRKADASASPWLVLALSQTRAGEMDKARKSYARARPAIEGAKGLGDTPRWLVDEAAALLEAKPTRVEVEPKPAPATKGPTE